MKPIPEKTYIVCRPSDGWRKTYITEKSAIEALNANPKNVLYEYTLTKVVKNEI